MKIKKIFFSMLSCMVVLSMLNIQISTAADKLTSILVNIHGTLKRTPCSFGNKPLTVEFGDVYIGKISGDNYNKKIDYSLSCPPNVKDMKLHMKISGSPADFDAKLIKTDVPGLAIKLLHDNVQLSPDEDLVIDENAQPKLSAVLIRNDREKLPDGKEFNGAATITVEWQ